MFGKPQFSYSILQFYFLYLEYNMEFIKLNIVINDNFHLLHLEKNIKKEAFVLCIYFKSV